MGCDVMTAVDAKIWYYSNCKGLNQLRIETSSGAAAWLNLDEGHADIMTALARDDKEKRAQAQKCEFCDGNHQLGDCYDFKLNERVFELELKVKRLEQDSGP